MDPLLWDLKCVFILSPYATRWPTFKVILWVTMMSVSYHGQLELRIKKRTGARHLFLFVFSCYSIQFLRQGSDSMLLLWRSTGFLRPATSSNVLGSAFQKRCFIRVSVECISSDTALCHMLCGTYNFSRAHTTRLPFCKVHCAGVGVQRGSGVCSNLLTQTDHCK